MATDPKQLALTLIDQDLAYVKPGGPQFGANDGRAAKLTTDLQSLRANVALLSNAPVAPVQPPAPPTPVQPPPSPPVIVVGPTPLPTIEVYDVDITSAIRNAPENREIRIHPPIVQCCVQPKNGHYIRAAVPWTPFKAWSTQVQSASDCPFGVESNNVIIEGFDFSRWGTNGVQCNSGGAVNLTIRQCRFRWLNKGAARGYGIWLAGGAGYTVEDTVFELENVQDGIRCGQPPSSSAVPQGLTVQRVYLIRRDCLNGGFRFAGARNLILRDFVIIVRDASRNSNGMTFSDYQTRDHVQGAIVSDGYLDALAEAYAGVQDLALWRLYFAPKFGGDGLTIDAAHVEPGNNINAPARITMTQCHNTAGRLYGLVKGAAIASFTQIPADAPIPIPAFAQRMQALGLEL